MGTGALRAILAFGVLSTAIHFTHNFVEIEDYPRSELFSDTAVRVAIVVSWPLFTLVALHAYRRVARGDERGARPWLVAYGLWALVALGHFTEGNPDIPPVWYATIWTDVLAGLLVLGFVALSRRAGPARPPRRRAAG